MVDDASAELRGLRDRLRKQRARLRGTLESYLRGKDTAKYLQQQVVTDRNGRYVLVVRAEHRAAIPGIVHGSSGSGASLFLEPLSTVEINNEIVAFEQQEREEVRRILLALSDAFRRRAGDLERTVEAATELDVLQARARFSIMTGGVEPILATDGRLELRAARHPLLIPAVRRHLGDEAERRASNSELRMESSEFNVQRSAFPPAGNDVVPVDILLIPPVSVLVITGPNTGGKTVALKTTGLLALMAQAGLHLPAAEGSQVTVLRTVFADIGDEQSIAQSLSTFSGHIANVVEMERSLAVPALVLLDEAGAGTDPVEGGALAMAVIEHFRVRGSMVVATTHYDALKSYASTTEGVTPAGFGFDPETFAPTYRLNYGAPGSSLAFEIANRLGLSGSILQRARAHRGERETQLADHLARMERDLQTLEHEHRLAARERATLEEAGAKLRAREQDLKNREETFRRRMDERIEERMREARREIDAIVERLRVRTETMAAQAERSAARLVPTGQSGGARADARAAIDSLSDRLRRSLDTGRDSNQPSPAPPTAASPPPSVGDRVLVGALRLEGIVQALHDRDAEVDVRGKRLRARLDDLQVVAPPAPAIVRVNVDLQPRTGSLTELNVIGCNVDEALTRAREVPGRCPRGRAPDRARDSWVRHRTAEARPRRVSAGASAGVTLLFRTSRQGWRWRHRGRVERVGMALFPASFIDDLKSHADIVQIVQERVPLRRSGATWKGLCPFHGEKTPSFHVNGDKGFFHCFGCGVGGDVIKFIELADKLTFPEAVRALAARTGLPVPEAPEAREDADNQRERDALLKAHEVAAAWFREQLSTPQGRRPDDNWRTVGSTPTRSISWRSAMPPRRTTR